MNLGDALRETLGQEAVMQDPVRPDLGALIHGGRARRRRRTVARVGVVAAASVLLAGGVAYGVDRVGSSSSGRDPQIVTEPSGSTAAEGLPLDPGDSDLEAGTYRVLVGTSSSGGVIEADLSVEGAGWSAGDFAKVKDGGASGGFGVYRVYALADGSGCHEDVVDGTVGQTVPALAGDLTQIPHSSVVEPATATTLLGYDALHLQLRIADQCPQGQYYRVAVTPRGSRGITYGRNPLPPVIIDFWVLDFDGVPVVVDSWHQEGASADLIDRIDRARDSITFVDNG